MKTTRIALGIGAIGSVLAVACSSGSGAFITGSSSGTDTPPPDYQQPSDPGATASSSGTTTTTDEGGTPTEDAATSSSGSSGSSSGSSGGGTSCPACDQTLTCTSGNATLMVVLATTNGACTTPGDAGTVTLDCNGNLIQAGKNIGTWTDTGGVWLVAGAACTAPK